MCYITGSCILLYFQAFDSKDVLRQHMHQHGWNESGTNLKNHERAYKEIEDQLQSPEAETPITTKLNANVFLTQLSTGSKPIWVLARWELSPHIVNLLHSVLLLPASNATSERIFSPIKRLKTALRSLMGWCQLNSLLMMHVHKNLTDKFDCQAIIKALVDCYQNRKLNI